MIARLALSTLVVAALLHGASGQTFQANYDESKIPAFELPNPLVGLDGEPVESATQWNQSRRAELLNLFREHVYGVAPPPCAIRSQVVSTTTVFDGDATRSEVDVFFGENDDAPSMRLLTYVPSNAKSVPAFLGLNFQGNHSVDPDPSVTLNDQWMRDRRNETTRGNRATEKARGVAASRWPVEMILRRGYGLVTIYYGDIDPDFDDGFKNGIHGVLGDSVDAEPEHRWGSIAAWAYGLSRALDFLGSKECPEIDAARVAVFGHSRLGKTSLWAGASDPRFAMVISNNSGCGGAALSRRAIGETIGRINTSFPHWFCDQFTRYNENENACPVDQHELLALIAPRPVYVASATADRWADPKGEFLSAVYADPVYRLLGTSGLGGAKPPSDPPPADTPINQGIIGYHLRTGKHDVKEYDWRQYLDFADRHLSGN
ncbi:MAG: acetylxylan esterase [Planctomycetota bacterium]